MKRRNIGLRRTLYIKRKAKRLERGHETTAGENETDRKRGNHIFTSQCTLCRSSASFLELTDQLLAFFSRWFLK